MNTAHQAPTQQLEARLYYLMSALLAYPEPWLIAGLPDIDAFLSDWPAIRDALDPLLDRIRNDDLIDLQEKLFEIDQEKRICMRDVLHHPWILRKGK